MALRDIKKKLIKLEKDAGVEKIKLILKDGSAAEFRASEIGEILLDSLRIMRAKAYGDDLPSDCEESLKRMKQFADISDEELERHPGYRWTAGLASQCLDTKKFTEEEIMELEKSCAGPYFEAMKNWLLLLRVARSVDPPISFTSKMKVLTRSPGRCLSG